MTIQHLFVIFKRANPFDLVEKKNWWEKAPIHFNILCLKCDGSTGSPLFLRSCLGPPLLQTSFLVLVVKFLTFFIAASPF